MGRILGGWELCGLCSRAPCRDTQRSTNPVLGLAWHWSLPALGFSCQNLVGAAVFVIFPQPWQTPPHRESLEPAWDATGTLLPVDILLLRWCHQSYMKNKNPPTTFFYIRESKHHYIFWPGCCFSQDVPEKSSHPHTTRVCRENYSKAHAFTRFPPNFIQSKPIDMHYSKAHCSRVE